MIIPFIEEAFFDKFNYNNIQIINDKMFDDINRYLEEINKIIDKNKILEEKILFYFETKIMMNLDREFNKETNNEKKKEKLKLFGQFLNLLESLLLKKNENNKKIIQLYSIAFIKCFLNKLVYICLKDEQKIGVLSEYNKIIAGDNYFKNSIKMYILKLIFDIKGNFNDFSSTDFHFHEFKFIVEKEINKFLHIEDVSQLDSSQNIYGFDYLIIPLMEDNKNDFAEFLKDLYEIKINNNINDSKLMKNLKKIMVLTFYIAGF